MCERAKGYTRAPALWMSRECNKSSPSARQLDSLGFSQHCWPVLCGPALAGLINQRWVTGDEVPVDPSRANRCTADQHQVALAASAEGVSLAFGQHQQATQRQLLVVQCRLALNQVQRAFGMFGGYLQRAACGQLDLGIDSGRQHRHW